MTSDRTAVVTGAAQGIGRRVAEVLAADGFRLILVDLHNPADTLTAMGGAPAAAVVGDLTQEATLAEIDRQLDHIGTVDVLVNNAGISQLVPAEDITADQWRRVLEVNLTAPFLLSQRIGRRMLAAGSGSIVNIASIAGIRAVADRTAYNTSKHGLIGLTRTLAAEWGGRGVRVNAVCPGWVKTEMDVADQAAGGYTDADITGQNPMGRFASADDIAQAVAFLADPARSGFVNGVELPVDGGWSNDASWTSLRLRKR